MAIELLKSTGFDDLTATVRDVVREASGKVGDVVTMPSDVAGQLTHQMNAQSAAHVLEVRRHERSIPADVLAIRLG
jgi:hypothetical protein